MRSVVWLGLFASATPASLALPWRHGAPAGDTRLVTPPLVTEDITEGQDTPPPLTEDITEAEDQEEQEQEEEQDIKEAAAQWYREEAQAAIEAAEAKAKWEAKPDANASGLGGVTVFYNGLAGVPKELEEAAALDGANAWQRLWHVKLPTLRPQIALVSVISSISALKVFDELYVMIPGAPAAEKTLVPLIYQTAFLDFRLGYASAISVALFLVTLAFSLVNLRLWEKDGAMS